MKEQCCVQENYGKVVLSLKIGVDYFLLYLKSDELLTQKVKHIS